jgi:hypothetical protein
MKTWRLILGFAMAGGLVVACSSDPEKSEDDTGTGGNATTTTTTTTATTTTTTNATTTATTTGAVDCSTQGTQCVSCCINENPGGQADLQALITCILCEACYTACDGAGQGCPSAPATPDACDEATTGDTECNSCFACAQGEGALCEPELEACGNNPDCAAIIQCANGCP